MLSHPASLKTDMSEAVRNKAGDFIAKKLVPMRRLGKPEDIAAVAVFLAALVRPTSPGRF